MSSFNYLSLIGAGSDEREDVDFTTGSVGAGGSTGPSSDTGKRSAEESLERMANLKRCRKLVLQQTPPVIPMSSHAAEGSGADLDTEDRESQCQSSSDVIVSLGQDNGSEVFRPDWKLTNGTRLNTPEICREFIHGALPPAQQLLHRQMSDQELSDGFCTALASLFSTASGFLHPCAVAGVQEKTHNDVTGLKDEVRRLTAINMDLLDQISVLKLQQSDSAAEAARANQGLKRMRADYARWEVERAETEKVLEDKANKLNALVSSLQMQRNNQLNVLKDVKVEISKVEQRVNSEANGALKAQQAALEKAVSYADARADKLEAENARLKQDRHWLISKGFRQVFNKVKASREVMRLIASVNNSATKLAYQTGLSAGYHYAAKGGVAPNHDPNANDQLKSARLTRLREAADTLQHGENSLIKKISESADLSLNELSALIASSP